MSKRRLVLAEKPKTAKAIAKAFKIPRLKGKGICYQGGDMTIIPAFGHLFQLFDFEDYDPALKKWCATTLPFVPPQGKFRIKLTDDPGVRRQFALMKKHYTRANQIIHAGDNDREGQYLIDEILHELGGTKPVLRFIPQALSVDKVLRQFNKLEDNRKFENLTQAAMGRAQADQLIGLNVTRSLTVAAENQGIKLLIPAGRVQSVFLALVVDRDRAIETFVPVNYFVPQITVKHPQGNFVATWMPNKAHDLDTENRLIKQDTAQNIVSNLQGQAGVITTVKNEKKKKAPPLPFTQGTLLNAVSSFGLGVKETADITQSIYEKGLITYPRTDNPHLDADEFSEGVKTLQSLASHGNTAAQNADPTIKSKAWKKSKSSDNKYAIVPSGDKPGQLTANESKIYNLIVERFVMQFYPPMEYMSQTIITSLGGEKWKTQGARMIFPGWTVLQNKKTKDEMLPAVSEKDNVTCHEAKVLSKKTEPPAYWTEGKLIAATERIDKFITDPRYKKVLRESAGIGTESTRPSMVDKLKAYNFIKNTKGTQVRSTKLGRLVRDITPQFLTEPATTAMWDEFLKLIEEGKQTLVDFMDQTIEQLPAMVDMALSVKFPNDMVAPVHRCPVCNGILTRFKKKKGKGFLWGCYNEDKHPDKKAVFLKDNRNKPGDLIVRIDTSKLPHAPCPEPGCQEEAIQFTSEKGFVYWKCQNKTHNIRHDNNGKPGDIVEFKKKRAS